MLRSVYEGREPEVRRYSRTWGNVPRGGLGRVEQGGSVESTVYRNLNSKYSKHAWPCAVAEQESVNLGI